MNGYLSKPIAREELNDVLQSWAGRSEVLERSVASPNSI